LDGDANITHPLDVAETCSLTFFAGPQSAMQLSTNLFMSACCAPQSRPMAMTPPSSTLLLLTALRESLALLFIGAITSSTKRALFLLMEPLKAATSFN
jgi:hypothetical protein